MNNSTKPDLFTQTPTIKPNGLFTRAGGHITKVHGVGSGPQDPPLGDTWWVRVDVYYEDSDETSEGVEYHPSQIVHDDTGLDNMRAISSAVMYHLNKHGKWSDSGRTWEQFPDAMV